jgi:CheY-like chemotaxis protein
MVQAHHLKTVLVVDDEALVRFELADLLKEHGFAVIEAQDADEAIAVMEADARVRLVITDIDMPGAMDGFRLLRFIRERWPPTALFVLSGRSHVSQEALPAETIVFSKPADTRRLLSALDQAAP